MDTEKAQYIAIGALATRWGVSSRFVRKMVAAGDIKVLRLGKTLRVPLSEVARIESLQTTQG